MSLVLPVDDWPEADQRMWRALRRQGGPFDDPGALKHLRTTSAETLEKRYGRWLRWLDLHEPAALQEAPTARATMPRLQVWLDGLAHTAPMSRLMFFDGLLRVMTAAAPEADWTAHRRVTSRPKRAAGRGDPSRKAGHVLSSRVLLEVGAAHAGAEADAASTPLQRAIRRRHGTLVAFLAMVPIRKPALAALTLDDSLQVLPDAITVILCEDLTKNRRPWEVEVSEPVAGLLRHYIAETRPFLMSRGGQRHASVWVGDDGRRIYWSAPLLVATIRRRF